MFLQGIWTSIRIVLFFIVMLAVAWGMPYEDLVDTFIYTHISYSEAEKITKQILGEPYPEPYDSISDYISLIINTLISVPLMGVIISAYNAITRKTKSAELPKEWALSILRRFGKIALFTFLFWALLRLLPYDMIFPAGETHSNFVMTVAFGFHLLSAVFGYRFITKIIKSASKTP
ncbi:hypothetical protein G7090_02795 [Leclercia sp. 29361]|uniref:hypothetical protein n=1 Tax=Leclercia sp. 29361 TaxID=2714951 RepID=UPI00140E6E3A|nr:hypothetical protein [Leclercia sp. 29361]QIK12360.1 hypothetical protein G7090_02795 [Leclercia sp. 29361]